MSNKKNQHFVPKVYLRQFSSDGKSIELCIKETLEFRSQAAIKNQSSSNYFYGEDLEIENFLSSMESDLGVVLRKISDSSIEALSKDNCEFLFGYTFLQLGRTEAAAMDLVSVSKEINSFVEDTFKSIDTSSYRVKEDRLANVKQSISIGKEMLNTSSDLDYIFIINDSPIDFITSDCPVSLYNQFHERIGKRSFGYGSIGTQILFPLSPRIAFLIYDHLCYKIGTRKSKYIHINSSDDVRNLNNITFVNANKTIYFLDRNSISSFDQVANIKRASSQYTKFQYENSGIFWSSNQPPLCNARFTFIRETDRTKHIKQYSHSLYPLLRKAVLKTIPRNSGSNNFRPQNFVV